MNNEDLNSQQNQTNNIMQDQSQNIQNQTVMNENTNNVGQEQIQNQPLMNEVPNNNSQTDLQENNGKSKKTLIIIIAVICLIAIGLGVYFLFIKDNNNTAEVFSTPDKLAEAYANNILNKSYDQCYKNAYLPKNNFVTVDHYKKYIYATDKYKNLDGYKFSKVNEELLTETEAKYTVTLKDQNDNTKTLEFNMKKDENNNWKIIEDGLYISDWVLTVPASSKLYINNTEVSKDLISSTQERKDKYVIPALYQDEYEFKVETQFQNEIKKVTPTSSNNQYDFIVILTNNEIKTQAYDFIKEAYNNIFAAAENNKDVSEIKKYFDDSLTIDTIDSYYTDGTKKIITESTGKNTNIKMTNIETWENEDCYVSTNDIITLNFQYTVNWVYDWNHKSISPSSHTMKKRSNIRLKYVNNEFKIVDVLDSKLFSYINYFTQEF